MSNDQRSERWCLAECWQDERFFLNAQVPRAVTSSIVILKDKEG